MRRHLLRTLPTIGGLSLLVSACATTPVATRPGLVTVDELERQLASAEVAADSARRADSLRVVVAETARADSVARAAAAERRAEPTLPMTVAPPAPAEVVGVDELPLPTRPSGVKVAPTPGVVVLPPPAPVERLAVPEIPVPTTQAPRIVVAAPTVSAPVAVEVEPATVVETPVTTRPAPVVAEAPAPRHVTLLQTARGAEAARRRGTVTPRRAQPPATPAQAPRAHWITGGANPELVTVNFYQDELSDVLSLFASVGGVSIIASDEESVREKTVTADIYEQPWNLALETILRANNLRALQDAETGIVTVQSELRSTALREPEIFRLRYVDADAVLPTLQAIIGATTRAQAGEGGEGASEASGDVIEAVRTGTGNERSRTLLVYTSPEKLAKIQQMIDKLDRRRPTVSIQARMVFVNRSELRRLGFNYSIVPRSETGTGQPGASTSPIGGSLDQGLGGSTQGTTTNAGLSVLQRLSLNNSTSLNVFFDALASTGLAEVEAAPLVTTTSDLQAEIQVGEFFILPNTAPLLASGTGFQGGMGQQGGMQQGGQQGGFSPVTPGQGSGINGGQGGMGSQGGLGQQGGLGGQYGGWGNFQTGTVLQVTPYVLPNGKVRVSIVLSRDGGTLGSDGRTITGGRQSARTEVVVDNNEMIVIGGLTVVSRSTGKGGIPVLQDLPLVGGIFRNDQSAEIFQDLVIVVQPKILDMEDTDLDLDLGNR